MFCCTTWHFVSSPCAYPSTQWKQGRYFVELTHFWSNSLFKAILLPSFQRAFCMGKPCHTLLLIVPAFFPALWPDGCSGSSVMEMSFSCHFSETLLQLPKWWSGWVKEVHSFLVFSWLGALANFSSKLNGNYFPGRDRGAQCMWRYVRRNNSPGSFCKHHC